MSIDVRLDGQVALDTGAASGIGRAIAESAAASGAAVGLFDLTEAASDATHAAVVDAGGQALRIGGHDERRASST